jgi:DNA-binding transcriptional LysR family regulator
MLDRFSVRTFYTLAKEKSFSSTANLLCLTQPAVSHQIHALEEYLETRLFDRVKGEVTLTPAGEILFKYAEQILDLYQRAEKEIEDLTNTVRGRLVIGASTTIGQYFLPAIIGEFKDVYPKIDIFLSNANTREVISQLLGNLIDLGFIEGPLKYKGIWVEKLVEDELVVIVSSRHRWKEGIEIEKEDLLKEPIILREQGSGTRKVIENTLSRNGIKFTDLNVKMELGSSESIKAAVEANLGIAIISKWSILKEKKLGTLKMLYVKGIRFKRDFSVIIKQDRFKTKPMELFLKFLKDFNK